MGKEENNMRRVASKDSIFTLDSILLQYEI